MELKTKIIIGVAIAIAIGLAIGIGVSASNRKKENDRTDAIVAGQGDPTNEIAPGFNPRPFTDSIFADCYKSWYCDTNMYNNLKQMSDDKIRSIFKDWDERYKKDKENEGRTLGKAISYAYTYSLNWSYVAPFHNKLIALGLE